jgi:hypothetical protein
LTHFLPELPFFRSGLVLLEIIGYNIRGLNFVTANIDSIRPRSFMPVITPVTVSLADFLSHRQGRRFPDVVGDPRLDFGRWVDFFNDPARQQRLCDAEVDHLRPALAGVIRELENHPDFRPFLSGHDANTTKRARQALGVLTGVVMEQLGWSKAGRKGALGHRIAARPPAGEGAYRNRRGSLSRWFSRAEHYVPPGGLPYPLVGLADAD